MATIYPYGDGKFRAVIRRKGHRQISKVHDRHGDAKKWAALIEAEIDAGRLGIAPSGGILVSRLIERYRDEIGSVKPFGRSKADIMNRLESILGSEDACALNSNRIVRYITKDRKITGVTAAMDLVYLKGILKVAKALWSLPVKPDVVDDAREILRYMGMNMRSGQRDRRPTEEELTKIKMWLALHSQSLTPDIIDFISDSCFRPPSEVVRLRWDDINHGDKTIVVSDRKDPRKKVGNDQVVPLMGRAYDIIMRQERTSEFIFPVNGHSWSTIFPRACHDCGIEDLRLYDLRHHAISKLFEQGYAIEEVALVSGHRDWAMLKRYTHLRAVDLHKGPAARRATGILRSAI